MCIHVNRHFTSRPLPSNDSTSYVYFMALWPHSAKAKFLLLLREDFIPGKSEHDFVKCSVGVTFVQKTMTPLGVNYISGDSRV